MLGCLPTNVAALLLTLPLVGCTFYTGPPTGGNGTPVVEPPGGSTPDPGASELDGGSEPEGKWQNVTANLAGLRSACGNLSLVAAHPTEDMVVAAVANRGLWATTDGGKSWKALGLGALSTEVNNLCTSIVFDPKDPNVFWESGINGLVGVLKTVDAGKHFTGFDVLNYVESLSVDFSDPDRETLLLGGHETLQEIKRSTDGGKTFEEIGAQFPASADVTTFPLVLDANTYLMGSPVHSGGQAGIYRSDDAGDTWSLVSPIGGQNPPLLSSDGLIYWSLPKAGGLVKSSDRGQTFSVVVGANLLQTFTPVELPGHRVAAVSARHIVVSSDQGEHWRFATTALPYAIAGFSYSPAQKAFFVWHSTCADDNSVPRNAIERFDFE